MSKEEIARKIGELPGHLQILAIEYLKDPKLSNARKPLKLNGVRLLIQILQDIREFHLGQVRPHEHTGSPSLRKRLGEEIGRASPELQAFIRELSRASGSAQATEILALREEVKGLTFQLRNQSGRKLSLLR